MNAIELHWNSAVWLPFGSFRLLLFEGFGFIDMAGTTVFVHHSQCEPGKQPKVGDVLTFTTEPRRNNPEQTQAMGVKGCSEARANPWGASPAFAGPVEGTGAYTGTVKNFGTKGYGFIIMEDEGQTGFETLREDKILSCFGVPYDAICMMSKLIYSIYYILYYIIYCI